MALPPRPDVDLDALIGDLRLEAARRRAAPDFPIEEEVRLGAGLDKQAPARAGLPLATRMDAVERRLGRLERRLDGPDSGGGPAAVMAAAATPFSASEFQLWVISAVKTNVLLQTQESDARSGVDQATVPAPPRRVLFWGAEPEPGVAALRAAGVDAYGIDPEGDAYRTDPDVRRADLQHHLRSVPDAALATAVLSGPTFRADPAYLEELAAELARSAAEVVVVAEAPWSWQDRVGPVAADLAAQRPIGAETWLAALAHAGFDPAGTRAEYQDGGRAYVVRARVRARTERSQR